MKNILCILSFLCCIISSHGQTLFSPNKDKLVMAAKETQQNIKIDGRLDEQVWQLTDSISNFVQIEPNQGVPAKFKTSVKVLYDNNFLYIGAFCQDPEGKAGIRVPDLSRDFSFGNNETFAVGIDGFLDERNTITLAVNPYGAQKDYLSFDDTFFDSDWNGLWKVRTSITDKGWYAEYQIPWKTIRYGTIKDDIHKWGINFVRRQRKSNEIAAWSPYPRSFGFNRAEYFGLLTNFIPPKPKTNIRFNPFFTSNLTRTKQNGKELSTDKKVEIGGELKWAINSNLLLDATINTDFAQADADVQVNNISRFSVFFPEKRQFFLENASLFGAGLYNNTGTSGNIIIVPFFSRRVGLSAGGAPLDIQGGLRLVNQSTKNNFGLMAIREKDFEQQKRYNFVGRFSKNFGKKNRIGFISTTRINEDYLNIVTGLDGFFRIGKAHSLGFMALNSNNTNSNDSGFGGYLQYQYTSNQVSGWWTTSILDKYFNPELGFISRQNIIANTSGLTFNYRGKLLPFKKTIRAFIPRITLNWYHDATNRTLTERLFTISPLWIETQKGGNFSFTTKFITQNISQSFTLLNEEIPIGTYNNERYKFSINTDASSRLSIKLNYEFGDFFNGKLTSQSIDLNFSPFPQIFLTASFDSNQISKFGNDKKDGTINLYTLKGRFFLNPRLSFVGLYQKNEQNISDFYNIRFAWEYNPLSYLYLVYNSNTIQLNNMNDLQTNQGIIKISYLKQF